MHAQLVVTQLADALAAAPQQHIHHVGGAEALAGAIHRREQLLGRHTQIHQLARLQAAIAVAAGFAQLLAEVAQQHLAAAACRLTEPDQGLELAVLDPLLLFLGAGVVDETAQLWDVARSMHHPGHRRQAIAAGAACFLVVGLQALGQIHVGHEAHVGFVDPHAEGDRGHDDHTALLAEAIQRAAALLRLQAGVVRHRLKAGGDQIAREALHPAAGAGVDDAGLVAMIGQKLQQLALRLILFPQQVADVGSIEAGGEHLTAAQVEAVEDFLAGVGISRGGER